MKQRLSAFPALLFCLLTLLLPAAAEPAEGVRDQWGECILVLREPVVSRTVVDNCRRLAIAEQYEARRGEAAPGLTLPTAEDCGLTLFTVSGSPAPKLRWTDQNKLRIQFAPGSSPETEYRLVFKPGTTYLGGAPLATPAFSFHCKPVKLSATWLTEHWGGAALLTSISRDTREAQEMLQQHEGLRVSFRRLRHVPVVGWVGTGSVPATLHPVTLADGLGSYNRPLFEAMLGRMKPEDIREDTPLPQSLLVRPERPLVPGAHYELVVEAAPGSGFESGNLFLDALPEVLGATLERELVQEEGAAPSTRLKLRFTHPVPEGQLRALWGRMGVRINDSVAAQQADGSYRVESAGQGGAAECPVTLHLRGLIPCASSAEHWRGDTTYHYSPKGCAQGLEMELLSAHPLELHLTLPPDVQTRHGLALMKEQTLSASISPAAPALAGAGGNMVALSGQHVLNLPLINVGEVTATAWHWDAATAARLLPVIQHGMRDDTLFCELYQRLVWMRRRAHEGLSTEGWMRDDARTEAARALKLLQEERKVADPLREQVLAAATAYAPQLLALSGAEKGNGLLSRGRAALDLDKLTNGQLRPGLYLISLSYRPTPDVVQALMAYGMKGDEPALACTVDFLVQVTDLSLCRGGDRLLVNSLATGQPLDGGQVSLYALPEDGIAGDEKSLLASARAEAAPVEGIAAMEVKQGEAVLPEAASDKLLLVQRGEDYALLSLWRDEVRGFSATEAGAARMELFCDRPLYRPGDVAHLRAVLRRPVRGGLALPRSRRGTLTIHKPDGEVMETRPVTLDAYGALAEDVTLPRGEDDVAGRYRCLLRVEESGKPVEAELALSCEVFRRDAFKASLNISVDPVAPKEYTVEVQARDYNGTPLGGGKVQLELSSTAPLLDENGGKPEGLVVHEGRPSLHEYKTSLVLDTEGRGSVRGRFGDYEEGRMFNAGASVANDREEYVYLPRQWRSFYPADVTMRVDEHDRLRLYDVREEKQTVLDREQEVELVIRTQETVRRELPSGIWYTEKQERELARHRITVPANCREGVELRPYWQEAEWYRTKPTLQLSLSARDAEGRLIREEVSISPHRWPILSDCRLTAEEGRRLRMELSEPFAQPGKLHAYIGSQGQQRHTLVDVRKGEQEVTIPLRAQEYGDVAVTLVSCGKDGQGTYTNWAKQDARCTLPRPDKELSLSFNLPAGAKPGDKVTLSGCVLGADGKPVKAAITLFAVDAGMMSVASYELPEFATSFYRGVAGSFTLESGSRAQRGMEPLTLPNVWSRDEGSWFGGAPIANQRSLKPEGMEVGSFHPGQLGGLFRWGMREVVRASQPNFRWGNVLGLDEGENADVTPAPAPVAVVATEAAPASMDKLGKKSRPAGLRSGSGELEAEIDAERTLGDGGSAYGSGSRAYALAEQLPQPRLRSNFEPVALWLGSLESAADGSFSTECLLPDTLTTYKVFAVALDAGGTCFGQAEGEFLVTQDLMLTAGTPFFMSTGDKLLLPLTVTNNRDAAGEWSLTLSGAGEIAPQQVKLGGKETATLYFEVQAGQEGECTLRWTARSADGADAVEGRFPVRYPAPVLKEAHRLVISSGGMDGETVPMLAPEVAESPRGDIELLYSTSPLIHLAGSLDFLLSYPYGCTEQKASTLLPWLFHEQLAPFCPQMSMTSATDAKALVARIIAQILARQQEDGGLSYWSVPRGERGFSSTWPSAYAGLVLTLAKEQGFAVPEEALKKLQDYLGRHNWYKHGYLTQYAVARTRGRYGEVSRILVKALRKELKHAATCCRETDTSDLEFMAELRSNPAGRHAALLRWLRSKGKDYRHRSSWSGGWTIIALAEYLKLEPKSAEGGTVIINGQELKAENEPASLRFSVEEGQRVGDIIPVMAAGKGSTYVSVKVKAQPESCDYPGVTEKGLQVTRVYEVRDADGQWRETNEFKVGDVVRVTLTCAKIADELEYFVLEDYLPACMEAINPNVPGQAAGLEDGGWGRWSEWFDHKEYLADRVRGFCTRWGGRDVVNMSYYARVKRAGESMAAPAQAQLMYEPQVYGLSPNLRVQSRMGAGE